MKQMNQFRNQVKVQQVFLFSSRICHSNTKQIDFWRKKKSPKWRGKKSFWLYVLRDLLFCMKSFRLHVLISYSSAKHWGSQCYYREFWRGEPQKLSLVAARTFISKFPNQGLLDMSIMTPDSFTKICYGDQALKAHYTTGQ